MALTWQPDEGSLAQIITLLKESQNPDTETQRAVEQVRVVAGWIHSTWNSVSVSPTEAAGSEPVP